MLSFYCGSVVTTNVLELLLTSSQQTLRYQFITLRHPGTFSKNHEINCKIVCYSNVSDLMCIYCHYRRLRTHYSLDMSRFHQIYDFMILRHPGTFMVLPDQKKLLGHYHVHQNKFPIILLHQTLRICIQVQFSQRYGQIKDRRPNFFLNIFGLA